MSAPLEIGLHAVVVAVDGRSPLVLTVSENNGAEHGTVGLPFGPFDPDRHKTLDQGLRNWVEEQTQLTLGYVEQLYTFGDVGRQPGGTDGNTNFVSVGYLALVRRPEGNVAGNLRWHSWYQHFPWEDWRNGEPKILNEVVLPTLAEWVRKAPNALAGNTGVERVARFRLAFGCDLPSSGTPNIESWDDEQVLERYELMYEAGLVREALYDKQVSAMPVDIELGHPMLHDHRRILATAVARLRAKLKYRPVVFELMPEQFTLTELQQTVETLSGRQLHKQNFRRLVEKAELVEPTGESSVTTGGRPAAYFRYRRTITRERPAPGFKLGPIG